MNIKKFTFIDLFAGIGGFHLALHKIGGKCVFASEMDEAARATYKYNFSKISPELFDESFNDDIRKVNPSDIPDFDVLCAGFPCQPFSQAGHKRGFNDNHNSERGNLFFNIVEIIDHKRPKAFFLENVRGIVNHDNGNTFKVIRNIIENELGYSFYFKVVHASDYGLPQNRPRAFMIGFRDESFLKGFNFPEKRPLKFTMDDVFEGNCHKKIGFTLRVGGRGSKIDDRRNWDSYYVDGEVKRITQNEGKTMQGFPKDYFFPVSETQAMKQLGNSVAVDAVEACAKNMIQYMSSLNKDNNLGMKSTKNKGEWSELFTFIKLLVEQKVNLSDEKLNKTEEIFNIKKVTTKNISREYAIIKKGLIKVIDNKGVNKTIDITDILNGNVIDFIKSKIENGSKTFEIPEFQLIQDRLGINLVKGGNSNQKSDIVLDIENDNFTAIDEGFGIKSFLGATPTLLNASGNTNFIFKVIGIDESKIDEINNINTSRKIKDRILLIKELGGSLVLDKAEKETMEHNLNLSDSLMTSYIGSILLSYYSGEGKTIKEIVKKCFDSAAIPSLESKIKRLLVDILLGFFAGTKWDGNYISNGSIILKNDGDIVGFHIIKLDKLKNYLYESIKLDTPSSTRHRFGKIYKEKNGLLYFKLNLQLRFI